MNVNGRACARTPQSMTCAKTSSSPSAGKPTSGGDPARSGSRVSRQGRGRRPAHYCAQALQCRCQGLASGAAHAPRAIGISPPCTPTPPPRTRSNIRTIGSSCTFTMTSTLRDSTRSSRRHAARSPGDAWCADAKRNAGSVTRGMELDAARRPRIIGPRYPLSNEGGDRRAIAKAPGAHLPPRNAKVRDAIPPAMGIV
jgi:hypothetical protein